MNAFKIGFIGLGLIGGSVAKSIHRIFPNYTIIGYDVNTVTLKEAQADGTLDHYTTNISDIADCDYVFLCAPVHYNIEYLKSNGRIRALRLRCSNRPSDRECLLFHHPISGRSGRPRGGIHDIYR